MSSKRKYDSGSDGENIWRFGLAKDYDDDFGLKCWRLRMNSCHPENKCRCLLCGHVEDTSMDSKEKISHINGQSHKNLVQKLKSKQEARIKQFTEIEAVKCELQRLGLLPDSIKTLLSEWVTNIEVENSSENSIEEMKRLCEVYQQQEPLVQLELALWKNACLLNPPTEIENSPTNLVTYHLRGGWKKNKATLRHDPMIGIVITNVLPFLDMS